VALAPAPANNEQRWPATFSLKVLPAIATLRPLLKWTRQCNNANNAINQRSFAAAMAMVTAEAKRGAFMPLPIAPPIVRRNGSVEIYRAPVWQRSLSTPANQIVEYQINDRAAKGNEGKSDPHAFAAPGLARPRRQLPLGEYNIQFWDDGRRNGIAAPNFPPREYKLPEFKVTVQTPEENGKKKSFRLGEKVK